MNNANELMSNLSVHSKYARWFPEIGRRETFEEIVYRNRKMHLDYFTERLEPKQMNALRPFIDQAYEFVLRKEVVPSMRSLQFAGEPIFRSPNRIFNCKYNQFSEVEMFSELMFLLLGGSGVGFSVRREHVSQLPSIQQPGPDNRYLIQDSIEGWSDAVDALVRAFFYGDPYPIFDFREIRERGAILKTSGGRAPGPEPLRKALNNVARVLWTSLEKRDRLRPIDIHDIACFISEAVLSGGIRRAAMISIFSPDDDEMLNAKAGEWYIDNPQRAFANNSAALIRGRDEDHFERVFDACEASGSGEPGFIWLDDERFGFNPCVEAGLLPGQACNLSSVNASTIRDQEDFNERTRAAAIIGTLQAAYTDFHYLRPMYRQVTEAGALLGVSMTGIASGAIEHLDAKEAMTNAVAVNAQVAEIIGINRADRIGNLKPEGTSSTVLGTSSGIHAWHAPYYIRRMRFNKSEPVAKFLMNRLPYRHESDDANPEIVEDDVMNPEQIVVAIPQKAPEGAITRTDESATDLLERVKRYYEEWVVPGNNWGGQSHNISATVTVKSGEWPAVRQWMWNNRYYYAGLSLLPENEHSYRQAPFQDIDRELYEDLLERIGTIDFTEIDESEDYTDLSGELACAGGACLIW